MRLTGLLCLLVLAPFSTACAEDDIMPAETPLDPDTAPGVSVDRFSAQAGHLMLRTASNGLPAADEPIDFDSGEPFITRGLGPQGQLVRYYNFDIQPTPPAPIYALFRAGENAPVAGQLNVVDVVPGDAGYNDFWQVMKVTVPADYVANTVTSVAEIHTLDLPVEATDTLVNCPIVPAGSTATERLDDEPTGLVRGWYRDRVVHYLSFLEAPLMTKGGAVPTSPIYVTFNENPDPENPASGPASGFVVEEDSAQTHNVPATLPGAASYSPLWAVHIYDNTDFDAVMDLSSAAEAHVLEPNGPNVNCPIVAVE